MQCSDVCNIEGYVPRRVFGGMFTYPGKFEFLVYYKVISLAISDYLKADFETQVVLSL